MSKEAEKVIDALKSRFRVATDLDLAERLGVKRSTVASWRNRSSVPYRYSRIAEESHANPFALGIVDWTDEERAACVLAMMRMHGNYLTQVEAYPEFLRRGGMVFSAFTVHLEKAFLDLQAAMERHEVEEPMQCLNLIVFEEFFADNGTSED